jgi:elongation factor P
MRANNLRRGMIVIHNKAPFKIMDFTHVTPGKGQAVVQTKLRNLMTGTQTELRYGATEDVEIADVYTTKATYMYQDADGFHFMDTQSYEQLGLGLDIVDDSRFYLQEGMEVTVTRFNDAPIAIELPQTVVLTVTETDPELKGATATNSPKPAICDTGLQISVPPFVKIGDRILINTTEGKYLSRSE